MYKKDFIDVYSQGITAFFAVHTPNSNRITSTIPKMHTGDQIFKKIYLCFFLIAHSIKIAVTHKCVVQSD